MGQHETQRDQLQRQASEARAQGNTQRADELEAQANALPDDGDSNEATDNK